MFKTPQSYADMLSKIASAVFFVTALELLILSNLLDSFKYFLNSISFGLTYEISQIKNNSQTCYSVSIAIVYLPLVFALFERIIKLHDRISDIFCIRYVFDKHVIIKEFCNILQITGYEVINNKKREAIMTNVFYKYAGYANPTIDAHLIAMALDSWCWYWIFIDTFIVTMAMGAIALIIHFSIKGLLVVLAILLLIFLCLVYLYNRHCKKYALGEVKAILNDHKIRSEVRKYLFDALHNK